MNSLHKSIFTFLFGIITSAYLWIRNEKSDRWIVIFFSVILANKILDIGYDLSLNTFNINNYLSIIGYILFLIHPLVNVLGSYSQIDGGLRIEPLVLTIGFVIYKLFVNPIPFDKIYTTKDGVFKYNFANYLTKYEIAAYLLLLIAPMFLYDPPKNAVMMSSTVFLLFISWIVHRRKLDRSISEWHTYLSSLLGVNMLFL